MYQKKSKLIKGYTNIRRRLKEEEEVGEEGKKGRKERKREEDNVRDNAELKMRLEMKSFPNS